MSERQCRLQAHAHDGAVRCTSTQNTTRQYFDTLMPKSPYRASLRFKIGAAALGAALTGIAVYGVITSLANNL